MDGCHAIGGDEGSNHAPASYEVGFTQCCSGEVNLGAKTCSRKHKGTCFNKDETGAFAATGKAVTHYEAASTCEAAGSRLCTKDELLEATASGCCGTGCGLNTGMAWTSTENVGASRVEVSLSPADELDWEDTVKASPYGTTFALQAGVYRQFSVTPRTGDTFIGRGEQETDVVLTGAKVVTANEYAKHKGAGDGIYIAVNRPENEPHMLHASRCIPSNPRCHYEQDLYLDGAPLHHVATEAEVVAGCNCWHFNYGSKHFLFEHADPTSHTWELSESFAAIKQGAAQPEVMYVTVKHLTVQMYASPGQFGAIGGQFPGRGWHVEGVLATLNHGVGCKVREEGVMLNNRFIKNGMQAASSTAGGKPAGPIVIDGNEMGWTTPVMISGKPLEDNLLEDTDGLPPSPSTPLRGRSNPSASFRSGSPRLSIYADVRATVDVIAFEGTPSRLWTTARCGQDITRGGAAVASSFLQRTAQS